MPLINKTRIGQVGTLGNFQPGITRSKTKQNTNEIMIIDNILNDLKISTKMLSIEKNIFDLCQKMKG